ncbi:tetratricopeptide repeat protein [Roseateles toxinivorans]|uniref:Tetratricopeptide repeat protein n=1 Tax=Roseateles toxinivorans TaxID=270368 RepID=A0A4R6QLN7_9BURK|nr:tetratricopeptide repeat protein [Roseateles toxinivorans]TDP71203.1 tetratricopeptide repeat protein [Roseateles toxinivorans]
MPDFLRRTTLARLLSQGLTVAVMCSALAAASSHAQEQPAAETPAAAAPIYNSELDAPLFYQLLIGEMELRAGEPGNAFQVLLDAARRTGDEALFRRVIGIALQARAGDQALIAARAWRQIAPESTEALQTTVQLLLGLNRLPELSEPLGALLKLTAPDQRAGAIAALPRLLQRLPEPKRVLSALEPVLQPYLLQPETSTAAHVSLARLNLVAGEATAALGLLKAASSQEPGAEGPALVALEMLSSEPEAEALVQAHLKAKPASDFVRLAYGRALARAQRHGDAIRELSAVTQSDPDMLGAWMSLGALQLDLRHPKEAETALNAYLERAEAATRDGKTNPEAGPEARQQAYLLLAQVAEQKGDLKAAEAWLAKVGDTKELLQVQYRRASVLARQGKLEQGRKLLQSLPEQNDDDIKSKLTAEAQLLRDAKQWRAAYEVLGAANKRFENDANLLYEQSMLAEKLDRMDEMERLLRKVIALKPDYHHAYNALGYSLAERNTRLDEAKRLIQKALELAPNEPFLLDSLGWVEYRMGQKDEALRLLQQAYKSRPDTEIAAHLGEVLWVMGKQEEAKRVWREGAGRDRTNEVLKETLARLRVSL